MSIGPVVFLVVYVLSLATALATWGAYLIAMAMKHPKKATLAPVAIGCGLPAFVVAVLLTLLMYSVARAIGGAYPAG